jgi:hypothetical protein
MERLHHDAKRILDSMNPVFSKLSWADRDFIQGTVDHAGGKLSENKWKKLYACLAQLAADTSVNYRVYESAEGYLYDTTIHKLTTRAALTDEPTHVKVENAVIQAAEADKRVVQLKRWKLEIEQLDIKVRDMSSKREELEKRYAALRDQFIREFDLPMRPDELAKAVSDG